MDSFLLAVERTVRAHGMAEPGERVLCALSGGVDSVSMTHALAALRPRLGVALCAAHFSHGIRPAAAERELELVRRLCQGLGIELLHGCGDTPALAREKGLSLEQAARALRYDFLRRAARQSGCGRIATAHHLDDSCETLLLNLARGSGAVGLGGIPPVRDGLIRPLIEIPRAEIEAYAARNGLQWAQDESNFDTGVPRNRVRQIVMPALREINPAAAGCMARYAELSRLDGEFLTECARALAGRAVQKDGGVVIEAAALRDAHPAVSGRAVRALYAMAGGREGEFTLRHARAVLGLCAGQSPSASADLPGGLRASRRYGELVLGPARGETGALPAVELKPGAEVRWGDWTLCREPADWRAWPMAAFLEGGPETIFVRPRAAGDVIALPGGHKSLKKWMIDRKIPQKDRDRTPVLCDNKKIRAVFWDRPYTAEKKRENAVVVAARRNGI